MSFNIRSRYRDFMKNSAKKSKIIAQNNALEKEEEDDRKLIALKGSLKGKSKKYLIDILTKKRHSSRLPLTSHAKLLKAKSKSELVKMVAEYLHRG